MKGELNPVTVADMTIQSMIVKYLTKYWPNIQIVGEETIDLNTTFFNDAEHNINDNV
jgi:3'-phosphoadenosine 5'-phosphosulfate (PAPS) 3'-phosphatase